jgi:hypothetical protein
MRLALKQGRHGVPLSLALVALIAVGAAGCGGSSDSTSPADTSAGANAPDRGYSAGKDNPSQNPLGSQKLTHVKSSFATPGAPSPVPSYAEDMAEASGTGGTDDYAYIHAHLEFGACHGGDWGTNPSPQAQSCDGAFIGGSKPFSDYPGRTTWSSTADFPTGGQGMKIGLFAGGVGQDSKRIDCFVRNRDQRDCLTRSEQAGKTPNQPGGPLELIVELHSWPSSSFLLLRGWCLKGDGLCTPN